MKIAVIGHTCTGKTILTDTLARLYPDHSLIRADDFKGQDFDKSAFALRDTVLKTGDKVICEGVQAVWMLRLGASTKSLFFDVVINCTTDPKTQMSRYTTERDVSKWHYIPTFNKAIDTVYEEYKTITQAIGKAPVFLDYKT